MWWPCLGFRWRNCWPLMTSNPTLPWWSWTSSSDTHLLSQTQVCAKCPLLNSMLQSGDYFTFVDWMLFTSEPCYQEFVAGLHQTLEWGRGLSPLSGGQDTTNRVLFSCLHLSVFLSDKFSLALIALREHSPGTDWTECGNWRLEQSIMAGEVSAGSGTDL